MKNIVLISIMICSTIFCFAQQEQLLTQNAYNRLIVNPAYAGTHGLDAGSLVLQYRDQWIGADGSPKSLLLSAESSFFKDRVGLGITVGSEKIGATNRFDISTNYAYKIELDEYKYLSAGIRGAFSRFGSDFSRIKNIENQDAIYGGDINYNIFSVGTGFMYVSQKIYVGLSIPAIATFGNNPGTNYYIKPHYYAQAGYYFSRPSDFIQIELHGLLKFQKATSPQVTLSAIVWFDNKLGIGGHWRSEDAVALSLEAKIMDQFRLAVSYDYTTSQLNRTSNGSLEFRIRYDFVTSNEGKRALRIKGGNAF